jgi:hypothetical protein
MPNVNGPAYASAQSIIGLALEATRGTAPSAPTYMIPVKQPAYDPKLTILPDDTMQGSMVAVYNDVRGMRYDSHGWSSYPYLDSFPLFLMAELGSPDTFNPAPGSTTLASAANAGATTVSTTASIPADSYIVIGSGATLESHQVSGASGTGPYTITLTTPLVYNQASGAAVTGLNTHAFSLLNNGSVPGNQPPSASIWDYDGEEWRLLTGGQLDELTIKGTGSALVDYTCTWFANPAQTNVAAPSASFTGTQTPAPWTTTILIGGQQLDVVVNWEIDLKRGVQPIPALTGTEEYYTYFAGPLQSTGKLTFVEQAGSPFLTSYLNGSQASLDIMLFDNASGDVLHLHSSKMQYTTGALSRQSEYVEVEVDFQLLPTAQDALAGGVSPILVSVGNLVASAYAA